MVCEIQPLVLVDFMGHDKIAGATLFKRGELQCERQFKIDALIVITARRLIVRILKTGSFGGEPI